MHLVDIRVTNQSAADWIELQLACGNVMEMYGTHSADELLVLIFGLFLLVECQEWE
jgi:hypothetical protein